MHLLKLLFKWDELIWGIYAKKAKSPSELFCYEKFILIHIDFVGNTGYAYDMVSYEHIIVVLPISLINTTKYLAGLKDLGLTLNIIYYIKVLCGFYILAINLTNIRSFRRN